MVPTAHCVDATNYYVLADNNQVIDRYNVLPTTDAYTINHMINPTFMDEGGRKAIDSGMPCVYDPENTTPVSSVSTRKDATVIDLGQYLADIISQDDYYYYKFHGDAPNINMDNLICYTFVK